MFLFIIMFIPARLTHPTCCYRRERMQSPSELEELKAKIDKFEGKLEETTDAANQTAILKMLAAMRETEVLLMRGEEA